MLLIYFIEVENWKRKLFLCFYYLEDFYLDIVEILVLFLFLRDNRYRVEKSIFSMFFFVSFILLSVFKDLVI